MIVLPNKEELLVSYSDVNQAWPASVAILTVKDASKFAMRLSKKFGDGSEPWYGRSRRSWASTAGTKDQNTSNGGEGCGWRRMVHDVSHWVHHQNHNGKLLTHSAVHAKLELEMIQFVVGKGWAEEKPVEVPTRDVKQAAVRATLEARLAKWLTKQKRAETAITKLNRQLKTLDRGAIPRLRKKRIKPVKKVGIVAQYEREERSLKRELLKLAKEHEFEFEWFDNDRSKEPPRAVYPPSGMFADDSEDPFEGDHTTGDWHDVKSKVFTYIDLMQQHGS